MKLKSDQARYVLDSSALIALVRGEPGSETVRAAMGASVVCAVNLSETMAKLIRAGGEPRLVQRYLRGLQLEIMPWDEELAWESRDLCSLAWTHGISFADRACLALARHLRLAAVTGDTAWKKLDVGVRVVLFRESKGR
ncbi:MAG: type II toxin-antitoxin system VapC family toxin [Bryobacteraceae bacterium]|jgi:PIN domain nuclease of toxin-antitoxin system